MSLFDAAYCLDELAVGRMPGPDRLLAGAMALHTRRGGFDLTEHGQARSAVLAALVRKAAELE